jgi:hypothetical protein
VLSHLPIALSFALCPLYFRCLLRVLEQFCEWQLSRGNGWLYDAIVPGREPFLVPAVDLAEPPLQAIPSYRVPDPARQKKRYASRRRVGSGWIVGRRIRIRRATQAEEPRTGLRSHSPHSGHVSSPAQDFRSCQGLGHSYGQAFAALRAAAVNDVTASGRLHPGPEPVSTLAADVRRLVCSFGHGFSSRPIIGGMTE